jgi:hypothetical protein
MQTFTLLIICSLLFTHARAQFVSDSGSLRNPMVFIEDKGFSTGTLSFATSYSAYEANIFNPVYQSRQRNFQFTAGVSQSFFLNPAQDAWVGNRPQAPITTAPAYPNFVPVQVSPSIGIQSNRGTFYSFSQGAFQGNGFNPLFRGINIVKPLGGRKP